MQVLILDVMHHNGAPRMTNCFSQSCIDISALWNAHLLMRDEFWEMGTFAPKFSVSRAQLIQLGQKALHQSSHTLLAQACKRYWLALGNVKTHKSSLLNTKSHRYKYLPAWIIFTLQYMQHYMKCKHVLKLKFFLCTNLMEVSVN